MLKSFEGKSRVIMNNTISDTWTVINNLTTKTTYNIILRGVTQSGMGPPSVPLMFTVPEDGELSQSPDLIPDTLLDLTSLIANNNTYLITGIVSGALVTFSCLSGAVFFICRRRRRLKASQSSNKGKCIY